jgi:mono/diheme cytochrome c family protein
MTSNFLNHKGHKEHQGRGNPPVFVFLVFFVVTQAAPAAAAEPKPPAASAKITYADQVRAVFREHCFACHNQNKSQNDLALDSYQRVMKGGASGEAVKPGDPDGSYLFALVSHKDEPHMPPSSEKLPAAKLALIRQWIAGGALRDSGSTAKAAASAAVNLAAPLAAGPKGEAIMPQGLSRQPVIHTARAGAVTAIAAAPWSPLAAVAGQHQVLLYHTDTGQLLGVLPFPEGVAYSIRFSRSGALVAVGGGKAARRGLVALFDVRAGKRLSEIGDELDAVLAADINAGQTLLALGGPERLVRVYSASQGTKLQEIRKHNDWISAVEFSPDGVLLATADRGGGLEIWEAETAREFQNLPGHSAGVTGLSFRADSNVLASGGEDGTIKLWNVEDGRLLKTTSAHGGGVLSLQFARDGSLVSGGRDRLVKLWGPNGNLVRVFEAFPEAVLKVAITHDGRRVIAGDWSGEIRLFNAADGRRVGLLSSNPPPGQ